MTNNKNCEKQTRRRQPEVIRKRILHASLSIFAARGFEGATLQQIASKAKVSQPLMVYHFKSKKGLWQAMIEHTVGEFDRYLEETTSKQATATEQLRDIIEATVRVSREFPEFRRIMVNDAFSKNARLEWMGENFAKRHHNLITQLIAAAQQEGEVIMIDPSRLSFLINEMATHPSRAAEYEYLTGKNPCTDEEVEDTIDAINTVVFIGKT